MKKLVTVLLVLAGITALSVSGYWAYDLIFTNETPTATVQIGEGETVQTVLTVDDVISNEILVPKGYGNHETELKFTVHWTATEAAIADLHVSIESLELGNLTEEVINDMFTFTYDPIVSISHDSQQFYFLTISFENEPFNDVIYNEVVNGTLIITLNFDVHPR